jgi:hypothetical protein
LGVVPRQQTWNPNPRSRRGPTPAAHGQGPGGRTDRLFHTGLAIASALTVFVGFAPTYYLRGRFGGAPLTPLVRLHGLVFTCWVLLYFAQAVLIARHRSGLHRRLGVAGAGLAVLLVPVGLATTVQAIRRVAAGGPGLPLPWLPIPLGAMPVFAILAAAGILSRRRPETHKRLMLLATISLLDAAVARWPLAVLQAGPVAWFVVTDLFVLAGAGYDLLSRGRIHPAWVWGGLLLLGSQPLRLLAGQTEAWHAFAGWLARL